MNQLSVRTRLVDTKSCGDVRHQVDTVVIDILLKGEGKDRCGLDWFGRKGVVVRDGVNGDVSWLHLSGRVVPVVGELAPDKDDARTGVG